ncbi:DUF2844 domain-containing protein [Paraburkholderia sp.]|uniref:DUF2844 domain-containing protein n=1 Tax=Paraburkholderia sp. TaxID=1926495 RepID=UPI003D6DDB1A
MKLRILRNAAALTAAVAAITATPAHAALGGAPTWPAGNVSSSASGSTGSAGTIAVRRMSAIAVAYTVNSTTLATGTVVREYVGQNGSVFAIAWQGPRMPQLGTLLGTYFPSYVQSLDETRAAQGGGIGSAVVQRSDLVVQSGGHMGNFSGRAWLPAALPSGVTTDDIQ